MVKLVGILNVTPDSFSDGGNFYKIASAIKHVEHLISDGADIIDVGGESSKPGSVAVLENEEIRRVIPVVKEIKKRFPKIVISIDTYKPNVASLAIDNGADIVNDIYAFGWHYQGNCEMADVVAKKKASVIIMHMKGTPLDMQKRPRYKDVISDIYKFFENKIEVAKTSGIKKEKIILDPGIGFGKTLHHNLLILKHLSEFKKLGLPIMVGPSRKSFIGALLNTDVSERIEGTIASSLISVLNGVDYLRVHDVLPVKRAVTVFEAIREVAISGQL